MKPSVLGIVPAREGSKRVPQKNFKPFADSTLCDLAIQQALGATTLDHIVVNSDAPAIGKIAKQYAEKGVAFLERPKALATDTAPAIDYMIQTMDHFEAQGIHFDLLVILQPSSPLRATKDIDATVQLLLADDTASSAVSVVQVQHMIHPHKIKTMEEKVLHPWLVDEGQKTAAHELPTLYVRNCAVYVFRTKLLRQGITYGDRCLAYEMPFEVSVDINDPIEFEFAEYLYQKNQRR